MVVSNEDDDDIDDYILIDGIFISVNRWTLLIKWMKQNNEFQRRISCDYVATFHKTVDLKVIPNHRSI